MTAPATTRRPRLAWCVAAGLVIVFLAGEPALFGTPTFRTGAALRAVLFALLPGVLLLVIGVRRLPARSAWTSLVWLSALPLVVGGLGLLGGGSASSAIHWCSLALLTSFLAICWLDVGEIRIAWHALTVASVVPLVFAITDAVDGEQVASLYGRPGIAGVALGAMIGVAWVFSPIRSPRWRWVPAFALAVGCVLTDSRTALIASGFGVLVALAISAGTPEKRRAIRLIAVGVAVLATCGAGLALSDVIPFPGSRETVEVRIGLQRASTKLIAERPLQGHGSGSFASEVLRVRDPKEAQLERGLKTVRRATHAHNDYLHVGVEGGLFATLALLLFAGGSFFAARKALRNEHPLARPLVAAASGVLTTISIAALADGMFLDPALALLAAIAVATILRLASPPSDERRRERASMIACLLCGVVLLGTVVVPFREAMAGRAFVRYRQAVLGGLTSAKADEAAKQHLENGALEWYPDYADAHYQLGVNDVKHGRFDAAKRHYREALRIDPGMTEARLDIALIHEMQGKFRDAKDALLEAVRRDPTRFDVRLRLARLALGPEPVPGDPFDEAQDWIEVTRLYNEAEEIAPERYENDLADAVVARRRARSPDDLAVAIELLEKALLRVPDPARRTQETAPADILLEAFRLAEAQKLGDLELRTRLQIALATDSRLAGRILGEATRFLDEGEAREAKIRESVTSVVPKLDFSSANRAFDAAAVRLAAVLLEGLADGSSQLRLAQAENDEKRHRRSLARYRALLALMAPPNSSDRRTDDPSMPFRVRSELFMQAAKVAARVDGDRSRLYYTRGFSMRGWEHLAGGEPLAAIKAFNDALEYDAADLDSRHGLAKALARLKQYDDAARELLEVLRANRNMREAVALDPDFAPLMDRPEIKRAMR